MDLYNEILHWSLGVISSAEPDDEQIKHALVRGDNMQFTSIAAGKARPRSREGMTLVNQTPFSNTSASEGPAIVGGDSYPYNSGGTTQYVVFVMKNGDVHFLLDDGETTSIAPTATFVGTLGLNLTTSDFAVMNNRIFILDGLGGMFSGLGTSEVDWGVDAVTGLALTGTGVGDMTGDYDVLVTGYNEQTGAESARSDSVSVTGLSSNQLQVTVDAVDSGLTHRFFRVYLRKPSLGPGFYRVLSGSNYDADAQGFPLAAGVATVSTTINISDATLQELVLTPPAVGANGLPPSGIKYAAVFQRRLFVADDDNVYWSDLDKPDAFNTLSVEPIKSRDPRGGNIVGMEVHAQQLHIFTKFARITLTGGTDLRSWVWDTADPTVGAVSNRAITAYKGWMYWWDEEAGPVALDPSGLNTIFIGDELIRSDLSSDRLNKSELASISITAGDSRVVWAVPETGQTRLTKMFSFHTGLKRWESTRWDAMDTSVVFAAYDTEKKRTLYLGNYNGQIFRMLRGGNDGVRTGTMRGTFEAVAESVTTIADSSAAFDVAGAGLKERKITILDSEGRPITPTSRPYITTNTATSFTLNEAVSGLTIGETYTYLIGGPDFVLETFWDHLGYPFMRKRLDRVFFEFRSEAGAAEVNVAVAVNFDSSQTNDTNVVQRQLDDATAGLWDQADWDVFYWDGLEEVAYSLPVIRSGRNYRIQIRSPYPDQAFTLLKVAMLGRLRADRYRRAY